MSTAHNLAQAWRDAPIEATHPATRDPDLYRQSGRREFDEIVRACNRYGLGDGLKDLAVLNYAAGAGREAIHLARAFGYTVLADTSARNLGAAGALLADEHDPEALGYAALLIDEDNPEEALAGYRFDVVLCSNLFLHVAPWDAGRLLHLFAEITKPGGLVAVQIPVYDTYHAPETWTSVGTWTPPMLELALGAAGLEPLELFPNPGPFVYPNVGANHARLHLATPLRK